MPMNISTWFRRLNLLCIALLPVLFAGCMTLREKNAALINYARSGDSVGVRQMLNSGADINTCDRFGDTPLHWAIKNNHSDTVLFLVDSGADINRKGALGDTPLHASIYGNKAEIAALLRQRGASESLSNRYGLAPSEMETLPPTEVAIIELAKYMNADGTWTDRTLSKPLYNKLKEIQDKYLINALVLQITRNSSRRLQVLLVSVKLGIAGSENKLVDILMIYGDKPMAEDYLNSGSGILSEGGRSWANARRFRVIAGPGSHRASWGQF